MYPRVEKPKQGGSRALAHAIVQKKHKGRSVISIVDNRSETHRHKLFQSMVDQSAQVNQLATYQNIMNHSPLVDRQFKNQGEVFASPRRPVARSGVVQKYNMTDDGHLVSSQKNLVLEAEASKDFYATDVGFSKSKDGLARAEVNNIEFSKGAGKTYEALPEKQFSKVVPVFKNITDTRVKSDTVLSEEKDDAQTQIPAWYDPFWLWASLVNIGSGFQPRFYKAYLQSVGSNKFKVDEIGREIQKRDTKNEYISTAVQALNDLLGKINEESDDEIVDISVFLNQPPGVQNVIEQSTMHFVSSHWQKQSKKAVREGLKQTISDRKTELEAQDQDPNTPYLPTDCGKLSAYLRQGAKSEKITSGKKSPKPKVGDYHYIDYSKRTDNGPWSYHYGTILFKDGADTVTLEDAAGQGTPWEKGHWYYMMYGTKGKQTFKAKTDQEYSRRSKIKPK